MKIAKYLLGAVVAVGMIAVAPTFDAEAQGPGIVMAGSENYTSLPKDARHFIEKHFKGVGVYKCENYYAKGKYEVELTNGVDIEFDSKGKVYEVDAPNGNCLASAVVRDLIPSKAYKRLQADGMEQKVESIEFDKRGRAVEVEVGISGPDTYVFDIGGNFVAISD